MRCPCDTIHLWPEILLIKPSLQGMVWLRLVVPVTIGDAVDPTAPVFFLSYAHSPPRVGSGDHDRTIVKFFNDLSENVAELVSIAPGSSLGFMDRSMEVGVNWTQQLLTAVGTCRVFVAMLSPRYFRSSWCSQEWFAFSQRRVANSEHGGSAIVPVIWAPFPEEQIPNAARKVQRFSPHDIREPGVGQLYESEGVFGLMQMDTNAYQIVVWRLAQTIARLSFTVRVEPNVLNENKLRDILAERSP
jgi:hypothetical protein